MRYLLDSLLEGYPIGSLLVCQITGESRVIRLDGGQRVVSGADRDAWQLLDGQQRINALFSVTMARLCPDRLNWGESARRPGVLAVGSRT